MAYQAAPGTEVFIVDDEPLICDLLSAVFVREGYLVSSFTDSKSFLTAAHQRWPSFILLDVNMPGRSGLDVLEELNAEAYPAPVFIMSGYRDIPTAIDAIRKGALDFIEKPFDVDAISARIRNALDLRLRTNAYTETMPAKRIPGYDLLTPRERDVLAQIAGAASNKEAARQLGISPRTVEVHRAHIMDKLSARNATDLMRIVLI